MADIDNLTIQITANAETAINALQSLSNALNTVNAALDRLNPDRMRAFASSAEEVNKAMSQFGQNTESINQVAQAVNSMSQGMNNAAQTANAAQNLTQTLNDAGNAARNAARGLNNVARESSNSGGGLRNMLGSLQSLLSSLSDMSIQLSFIRNLFRATFSVFTAPIKLATRAMRGFSKASDTTTQTAKKLAKELTRVGKMLKLMVTRMALRAVIKEVGNGFKSLALHSDEFNQTVSNLINGSKKLGYSFSAMVAPLIQALAPALIYVINLLTKLMNAINQVFASLSGAGTWNKAKDFTDNWADDIKSANKQAKELKKTVLGFDELNQLQEKYTGGGDASNNIVDMFETLPIEDKWKDVANYIKKTAKRLFDPIKKAWDKVGNFVKKSWKYAMEEIGKLGESVARDFWKVWEQEKTQKIFENILKIIGWIGQAVGNLTKRFREAWDKNNTGLHIFENIRDIILIITDHFESMARATAEWADSLDFSPILEKFNEWLESCKEPADQLMGILEDFYTKVLLPIGKWAVEEGGKQLLQVFIDFNNKVEWGVIRERLNKLWEALEPFAETVGEGLIKFIGDASDKVAGFLNSEGWNSFIDTCTTIMNDIDGQDVYDTLKLVADGFLLFKGFEFLTTAITKIGELVVAIQTAMPYIQDFAAIFTEGFVIGSSMLWDNFIDGTCFDPDEWENTLGYIIDIIGIYFNNLVLAIALPLEVIPATLEDIASGKPFGTSIGNFFKENWQYIDDYKAAYEELKAAGKDAGGSYEDVLRRAKMLHEEQTTGLGIVAGAAKEARTSIDGLQTDLNKWQNKNIEVKNSNEETKKSAEELNASIKNTEGSANNYQILAGAAKALNKQYEETATTASNFSNNIDNLTVNLDNSKANADKLKGSTENLNQVLQDTDNAYKNYKGSLENGVKYTPVFTESQKKIEDSLKNAGAATEDFSQTTKVEFENVDLAVANTSGAFGSGMYEIQTCVKDGTDEITAQTEKISDAFSEDNWTFDGVVDGLKNTFKDAIDGVKGLWNKFADKMNEGGEVGSDKFKIKLPRFAGGGFPENGLFLANSTEMVGRFSNGKTAVANNSQIVEGISAGVYSAVSSALAQNSGNSNGGYIANTIVVDGEVIARTITKAQQKQNMRYSPSMG